MYQAASVKISFDLEKILLPRFHQNQYQILGYMEESQGQR